MGSLPPDIEPLLSGFNKNPPCASAKLATVEQSFGTAFPVEYQQFMATSNGGEGSIGAESYLILDPVERLKEYNLDYQVAENWPGLVLIGSDGGGMGFAFDVRDPAMPMVAFDFTSISPEDRWFVGATFWEFLMRLGRFTCGIDWDNPEEPG
ncbi:MAG: SMI1/KNR4 family protein [Planctomycetota bacterium]